MEHMLTKAWVVSVASFFVLSISCTLFAQNSEQAAQIRANAFWTGESREVTNEVALQAAVAYELDSKKTIQKLQTLRPRDIKALYILSAAYEYNPAFESLYTKKLYSFVALLKDMSGQNKYVKTINGKLGEGVPGQGGSGDGLYLFFPESEEDVFTVLISDHIAFYTNDSNIWENPITVYCDVFENGACNPVRIDEYKSTPPQQ